MAIDPHLKKQARPLPVQPQSWAGPGGRGIIPYGCFDQKLLQEAVAILQGTSKHYYFTEEGALQKVGAPPPRKPVVTSISKEEARAAEEAHVACVNAMDDEEEAHGTGTEHYQQLKAEADRHFAVWEAYHEVQTQNHLVGMDAFLGTSEDFSDAARQSLYAVLCILANTALKQTPAPKLEELIKLTVRPHYHKNSAQMQDFLDFLRAGASEETIKANTRESTPEELREWCPLKDRLEGIQELMDAYRDGESIVSGWYYDTWKGAKLLKVALGNAKDVQRGWDRNDIWKLHNQCPEAVNFILAAPQAEFLLEENGPSHPITENLQHFLNSPWMGMAGNIDLTVDPTLLTRTRDMLDYQPLRTSKEALSV